MRSISGTSRLTKTHKLTAAGIAAASTAALAVALVPGTANAAPQAQALNAQPVAAVSDTAFTGKVQHIDPLTQKQTGKATDDATTKAIEDALAKHTGADAKKADADKADAKKKAAKAKAKKRTADTANRSEQRTLIAKPVAAKKSYANNLDGWIRESLDIMKDKGIPGTYEGIHRNIMRESSGNTQAINNWDINAVNGIPSKGLLQVIDPTFKAYHVDGTAWDIYDPVANITAACNYAADRYGSMDNVNSAY